MKWWNQKVVVQEESIQEENVKKNEGIRDDTEFTMAVPDLPLAPALRATSAQEIVLDEAIPSLEPQTKGDGWNI